MERSPEIEQTLRDVLEAVSRGDDGAVIDAHARGDATLVIGTDEEEWLQGFDVVTAGWRNQAPVRTRIDELYGYQEHNIGWAAGKLAFLVDDGELRTRFTTVFRREGGRWKVVHSHTSVPRTP